MRRILHIIPTLDQAGAEKQLTLLAAGLPRSEFDVHVCALTRGGELERSLDAAGIPWSVIGKRWKADPLAYLRLKQHIRRLQPDLVQTWMFTAGAYGRSAASAVGVKHVVASERCVDRWKPGWVWSIDRRLAPRTTRLIANSTGVRDYCVEHGLPAEKFVVIPNGVPPAPATTTTRAELLAELGIPSGTKLIGAVGRLWPQKRVKDVIWIIELMHILHKDLHLLVIGDGPQRSALERYASLVEADSYTHFLGHRNDVARIVPHLDIFWQASGYEGMPNAMMEAMAAGIPVIATDIAGHRDLVVPGETGYLCPIRGRKEFCRETDRLLTNPHLSVQLGAAGRRRMLTEFTVERMVERHAELYREILS